MKRYIKSSNNLNSYQKEILDEYIDYLHNEASIQELSDTFGYDWSEVKTQEDKDELIDEIVDDISEETLYEYFAYYWNNEKEHEIHVGDYVRTPRFLNVKIEEVFDNEEDCRNAGYIESTDYRGYEYGVLGKSIDLYHMEFAAYKK